MKRDPIHLAEPPNTDRPGDRWMCGRTGDPCLRGPVGRDLLGRGRCTSAQPCRPRRTWHGRRKQFMTLAMVATIALMIAIAWPSTRAAIVKPGELSTPHAQILSSTLDDRRCAVCHPQASSGVGDWFDTSSNSQTAYAAHQGVSQSDRCLDCHHGTIDRASAMFAHNLPPETRNELRLASLGPRDTTWRDWLPSPAVDQNDVQCSACHREHRGADASLTSMSNDQCQTCHSDRFASFADSHPNWNRWPYGRGGQIAFDHASHMNKHFPATIDGEQAAEFQCGSCHARTSDGELTRSTGYEQSCQSCHDASLRLEASAGVELVTLPSLSNEAADAIGDWPDGATGFFDGRIAPLAQWLMRVDSDLSVALQNLPELDYARIDEKRNDDVEAASTVARGLRDLLRSFSSEGQPALIERIQRNGVAATKLDAIIRTLPLQLIEDADRRWFGNESQSNLVSENHATQAKPVQFKMESDDDLLSDDSLGDSLLGDDLSSADPLAADPLLAQPSDALPSETSRFDADAMLPSGGWYRDDLTYSIRYRGGGHADPVVQAAVELAGQLNPGDPVRQRLLETRAVKACVACHQGAIAYGSAEPWRCSPNIGRRGEFTKFTHSPHLNIANLSDCRHCHEVGAGTVSANSNSVSVVSTVSTEGDPHEFLPMQIEACASCHTPHAAGDACVKCHRYHIDSR